MQFYDNECLKEVTGFARDSVDSKLLQKLPRSIHRHCFEVKVRKNIYIP